MSIVSKLVNMPLSRQAQYPVRDIGLTQLISEDALNKVRSGSSSWFYLNTTLKLAYLTPSLRHLDENHGARCSICEAEPYHFNETNKWSPEIRNFQSLTQKRSIGELLCVSKNLELLVDANSPSILSWHTGLIELTTVLEKRS